MKTFEIENTMNAMVGKKYNYGNALHHIIRFDVNETRLKITTDVKDIVILCADISEILPTFIEEVEIQLPVRQEVSTQLKTGSQAVVLANLIKQTTIGSMAQELRQEVKEAIDKVKVDKNYIPQATAINDGIKQILDIAKAEIEMFKVMDSINRS